MSSEGARLKFNRPLREVKRRTGGGGSSHTDAARAAEEAELSEQRQRLEAAQLELSRREEEIRQKEKALEQKLAQLASLITSLSEQKAEMLESSEQEIVSFSLSITQKVLQYEIENGRYKIGEVVKSTLRAVRDRGSLVVRVNPRDHELAKAAVEKLEQTYGTTRITTVPDESISLASCCIETDSGKIFSEIPGRLERIEKSLLKKDDSSDGV